MHEQAEQLLTHLKATWNYRWFAVGVAWVIALGGWAVVHRMPDRYEASTRVYVDTQSVLTPLLGGLAAQPNFNQLMAMFSRTLISRPNMDKVIHMADMEADLVSTEDREQLITRLTKEVILQSAGGENLYSIAYTNKDPQKAKMVVQSLLSIFTEGSKKEQRHDTEDARAFIDEQLTSAKERLDVAERAMVDFKRRQLLAAGVKGDYTRLVEAKAALNEATLELKVAEINRDAVKRSVEDDIEVPSLLGDASTPGDKSTEVPVNPEIDARISALQQKVDALLLNYTPEHPDIVAYERIIAQLKEQKKAEPEKLKVKKTSPKAFQVKNPLTLSLATAEANLAATKARVAEYARRYEELTAAAAAAPETDARSAQVTRDYEIAKVNYGALLARRETARMSGEVESKSTATDFRVVDPPRVSSIPKSPNRPLLNSIVLLMALAGGAGFAFVLSQIRPTFNDEGRLRAVLGVPVLGTVVMAWTDAQKARRIRGLVAFGLSFVSLLSAYAAIMMTLSLTALRV